MERCRSLFGAADSPQRCLLEAGVGISGTVLEARMSAWGGGEWASRSSALGPSPLQPWAARAEERFSRCRAAGETAGRPGVGVELCARADAALVANGDAAQAAVDP